MGADLDYKPNSHKFKQEQQQQSNAKEKKVEKIVKGKVKTKKKSGFGKVKDAIISEDASNVKSYVFGDVLIPAIKKAISDIVRDGIDMILYGEPRSRKSSSNASYVSYRSYSDRDRRDERRSTTRSVYNYDDIILDTRGEAEDVLTRMDELIDTYGIVSVADMYDLVGISGNYTDNKYGWTNLRNAEPIRVHDGYMLKLPKPGPIN